MIRQQDVRGLNLIEVIQYKLGLRFTAEYESYQKEDEIIDRRNGF